MAIQKKPCLVCGRLFKPCSTITEGLNWRRSFCSPECCQEWMRRQQPVAAQVETVAEPEQATAEEPQEEVKPARRSRKKDSE